MTVCCLARVFGVMNLLWLAQMVVGSDIVLEDIDNMWCWCLEFQDFVAVLFLAVLGL